MYINGEKLTEAIIPDGVTSIGDYAFYNCSSLTSITIPDSVTSIGTYAFFKCKSLTEITIPDGVTSIGEETFGGCSSLTNVTFADIESVWYYTTNSNYTEGTSIGAMSAIDTEANATLLRSTYSSKYLYNGKYGQ